MRSNPSRTFLHASILAGLVLTFNTEALNKDANCSERITVKRNTSYEGKWGQTLEIICPVWFCDAPPTVLWYKNSSLYVGNTNYTQEERRLFNQLKGKYSLRFERLRTSDSGRYQCKTVHSVSHAITVLVHGDNETETTLEEHTESEGWIVVYAVVGTVSAVVAVFIVTVVLLRGCKGRSKKEPKSQTLFIAMEKQPSRESPRASPHTQREMITLRQPKCEIASMHDASGEKPGHKDTVREEEEEASIVYTTLNHELPSRSYNPGVRPPKEPSTIYASLEAEGEEIKFCLD